MGQCLSVTIHKKKAKRIAIAQGQEILAMQRRERAASREREEARQRREARKTGTTRVPVPHVMSTDSLSRLDNRGRIRIVQREEDTLEESQVNVNMGSVAGQVENNQTSTFGSTSTSGNTEQGNEHTQISK